jgi:hypothetical protein
MIKISLEMTADILNVSLDYAEQLVIRGVLNDYCDSMDNYTLNLNEVIAYRNLRDLDRCDALRELTQEAQLLGEYDAPGFDRVGHDRDRLIGETVD